jgi:hypothetical protein
MGSNKLQLIPDRKEEIDAAIEYVMTGQPPENMPARYKEIIDTVHKVDDVIRHYVGDKEQLNALRSDTKFSNMSRTQLYRYRDAARQFIGSTHISNKGYDRLLLRAKIQKGFEMAEKLEDTKLFASMVKEFREDIRSMPDNDEDQAPVANVLVIVNDGQPEVLDLTDPSKIPAQHRKAVVAALFNTETPQNPSDFIDAEEV